MTYQQPPQPPQQPYGQPQYGQPPPGQPPYGQQYGQYPQQPYYQPAPSAHGASVASLVLGICGVVFCWIPVIGFFLQIAALITGIIGAQHPNGKGMAIAGLVMGAIMLVLGIAFWAFIFIAAASSGYR
jgi:hypothetical protein